MINIKLKTKLFFFFFLTFSFFLIPYSFINVKGYTPTIRADWLYVTTGAFKDSSPHSYENNLKISSGGIDLLSFENLGIVSYSDDEVLYKARTTYGFEITAHTDAGFNNIFPNINRDKQYTQPFFRIQYKYVDHAESVWYDVSWNTIQLGAKNEHDYNGVIPVSVGIRDIIGNTGSISLNGQTFETPAYTADVVKTYVTSVRRGEVGGYEDQFIMSDVDECVIKFKMLDDDFTDAQKKVVDYYNSKQLGWKAGAIQKGQTLQQAIVGGAQKGTEYTNPTSSDLYTFYLGTRLQPEVYEWVQYNKINYAEVKYWTWGAWAGDLDTIVSPKSINAPKRITAVHVDNQFIHWEFEVIVDYYATVESTAELTQAILDDPFLYQGDVVWDASFTGVYDADIVLQKRDIWDWVEDIFGGLFSGALGIFMWIIIIIIVILGVYIFIRIGIPLIRRKIMRRRYY